VSVSTHRLIFFYHNGYFPEGQVDHIDRNKKNNRIENLREVSRQCNLRNTGNSKANTSGVKGVSKHYSGWKAGVTINGKNKHICYTKDFDEAVLYRFAIEQCIGWNNCDKNSPAMEYAIKNKLINPMIRQV